MYWLTHLVMLGYNCTGQVKQAKKTLFVTVRIGVKPVPQWERDWVHLNQRHVFKYCRELIKAMRGGRDECLVQLSNVSFLLCGDWEMGELTSSLISFQRNDWRALRSILMLWNWCILGKNLILKKTNLQLYNSFKREILKFS